MPGTITGAIERINTPLDRPSLTILTLTCTGDSANGSYPATVINTLTDIAKYDLRGLKLYSLVTSPGTTGPTDNSDMTITDKYGIDILGGAGANIVDNSANNRVFINPDTAASIITGNWTINITNNSVDSAVTTVVLELLGV